jgi:hypothetical protein
LQISPDLFWILKAFTHIAVEAPLVVGQLAKITYGNVNSKAKERSNHLLNKTSKRKLLQPLQNDRHFSSVRIFYVKESKFEWVLVLRFMWRKQGRQCLFQHKMRTAADVCMYWPEIQGWIMGSAGPRGTEALGGPPDIKVPLCVFSGR